MDCELLTTCIFFNDRMKNMPAMSELYKRQYCRGDKTACARYMVFAKLGREKVPQDLFPNQTARATAILSSP